MRRWFEPQHIRAAVLLVSVTLALQACGGGGGGGGGATPAPAPINRAPALGGVGDQTVDEGSSTVVSISATDADGDPLTFEVLQQPDFVGLENAGGGSWRLTVEPGFDDGGEYAITVRVVDSDGASDEETFTLHVVNVNRAPALATVGDVAISEGQSQTLVVTASDPDGDAVTFTAQGLPAFIAITDNGDGTASLELQPGYFASGVYAVSVQVADSGALIDETNFVVRVTDVNRAPLLTPITAVALAEGEMLEVPLTAIDPDGDSVALSVSGLPAFGGATDDGDGTGSLNLVPGFFDSGAYTVTVRATDSGSLIDELSFMITVSDVNRPPVLSAVADLALSEDETLVVPLAATDPDGDSVALSMAGALPFATLTDNGDGTGTLDLRPGFADSGVHSLDVRATDSGSAVTESAVTVTVTNVNRDPSWTPVSDQALSEGETLVVAVSASDPDEDDLVLSGVDLPAFVNLIDNGDGTGSLDVQPGFSDSGIYPVTLEVIDALAAIDEIGFYITVGDVNRPPELPLFDHVLLPEGSSMIAPFDAIDPDGDDIALAADGLPAFITLIDEGGGQGSLRIEPQLFDAGVYTFVVRATDTGFPSLTDEETAQFTVQVEGSNQVARENTLPGTADWHLDDPALAREIEGYASATSVNRGETISLYVNTLAPAFTLEVFRTGWYQGLGARRVHGPVALPGTTQTPPSPDPVTGLVEANWIDPYALETRDAGGEPWTTGVYLARLTESVGGRQSYILFVVREDGYHHDVLFQLPVTTYQAYNAWGGKSIYDFNSGAAEPWGSTSGTRASHVSFDRPYARNPYDPAGYGMGAGEYLTNVQPVGRIDGAGWDYNMVRWLEYEQYDVGYITNIDTHRSQYGSSDTEVFVSQGHDEYWSWEMRDNVEWARDQGVDLAFFASNAAYYQIRFEPSPTTAVPDRIIVGYKSELDPVFTDGSANNDHLTTVRFRDLPVPRPEETLIGVQYVLDPYDGDIIVTNPTHWVFDKTGLVFGSRLGGLLGYEPDGLYGGGPANLEVLAATPIVSSQDPTDTGTSHMTIYSTGSASVFATGSLQWSWGLDDYNVPQMRTSRLSAAAQQITENVLQAFGAAPRGGEVVATSCVRIVSLSDADDDQTMAAAELDFLDADGYEIPKTGWSLFYVDSQETFWMDGSALNAFDGDPATFWQTEWYDVNHPHEIQIDLGGNYEISALRYLPRQDFSLDGTVSDYEIYTSPDCASWSPVAAGTWEPNSGRKLARFTRPD